ncbi:hypothetical protein AVEN_28304-1 [Araneus ventricosus]|uniref:Uncharacterized protein n=1 Tax=Araneus ventricosus TaxID=182803 RepID=A0A4Y2DHS4_ARAVE|nr:hypothetical protein AVEN_28304-1 [Araneus ventricosus]
MARSPTKGTRRLSAPMEISQTSVKSILWADMWHPYKLKMLQLLTAGSPARRIEFYEWALNMHDNVPDENWLERLPLCVDMEARHVEHIL